MRRNEANAVAEMQHSFKEASVDYRIGHESKFRPRLQGVDRLGSSADYHYRNETAFYLAMEQAREFDRNDPVVGQGITRCINNIFQSGFQVDPDTGDKDADKMLTDMWGDWSESPEKCHSEKEHNFHRLARLAYRAAVVDGDHEVLPLRLGSLQMVEAHRLRNPRNARKEQNVVHGVRLNDAAERIEFWITKEDLGTFVRPTRIGEVEKVRARGPNGFRNVLQLYDPKRLSQRRGVSMMAPIADTAGMFGDVQFAMLVKQQVASCFAILSEMQIGAPPRPGQKTFADSDTAFRSDGTSRTINKIVPGMFLEAYQGEKLSGFSPNIPGEGFLDHSLMILNIIAINLGVPVSVLLLDPSNTNFSGWRGAIDEARKGWKEQQDWFCSAFHKPIYEWKIRQWLNDPSTGLAEYAQREGVNLFRHSWNKPRWSYIEPLKDITAGALEIRTMQTSPRRSLAARGLNFEQVLSETIADNRLAIESAKAVAKEINQQYPDEPVNWMQLLALPMPDGVNLSVADPSQQQEQNQPSMSGERNA